MEVTQMDYAEASYFDGYAFQHIAAYFEAKRIERKRTDMRKYARSIERRRVAR
jgi:hypothetical protein